MLDEIAIETLRETLNRAAGRIDQEGRVEIERFIRSYRVGVVKQRALLGALGINV